MPEASPDIRLKRIYDPPDEGDGARVLVDRLWPRGVPKETARLTLWMKEIAPSPELREWFRHDPSRFAEFSRRYRTELAANKTAIDRIEDLLKLGPVTLLYAARDSARNHAQVLREYFRSKKEIE
ncbi:MAG: DUF488 domain-containing protein [Bacteroidota bacterium]